MTFDYMRNKMEAMHYYNSTKMCEKRANMLANKDDLYVATEKHDGNWSMFAHRNSSDNLIRSRSISKVTGEFGDETAKVPHFIEIMDRWPNNTVVLAELCWSDYGTNANTVGTILRCKPDKAVERQKEHKLSAYIFDVLMYDGVDLTAIPYIERLEYADKLVDSYVHKTQVFLSDFELHADEIIAAGGEGVVIQLKDNGYYPDTKTAWKSLKLKQGLPTSDYQVVGFVEPNKCYDGDQPNWEYEIDGEKVTKPYYYGWKTGVVIKIDDITCRVSSGMTDEYREWCSTEEAAKLVENGQLFAEVKGMSINDKGRLRHPVLVKLRTETDGAAN